LLEQASHDEITSMGNDKRPQDWTSEERLNMVDTCAALSGEALNAHCRMQGIYPHHVKQWKLDFITGNSPKKKSGFPSEIKTSGENSLEKNGSKTRQHT
jgi:transposase